MVYHENDRYDYLLFIHAELKYEDDRLKHGAGKKEAEERPDGWYAIRDYHGKTEILTKAIKAGVRMEDLPDFCGLMASGES